MNAKQKIQAIIEVFVVAWILVPVLTLGTYWLIPDFETWQTDDLGFAFPVFTQVIMVGLSVLIIWLRRKNFAENGLQVTPVRYHLDIAAACFIPFVLAGFPLGFGVDYKTWGGALIMSAVQIGLLFVIAFLLRKKQTLPAASLLAGMACFIPLATEAVDVPIGKVIALFLTYALFVGFGEEILYRGYMQSRLNEVFGKPYQFFGVTFGWGAIITALLFGLSHAGIISNLAGISTSITLPWSLWTFFGGLVFGFVREKTGSILAPAILHGLPQAIATVAMLYI